jgi:HAE1 family hydrophobic/amphiphilic exporter-1
VQKLAEICIKRPIFAAMMVLALVVVGAAAYFNLGVNRFPAVDLPTVMVRSTLPGGAAEDVESEITEIIEQAVNTVEGVTELRSITGPGSSVVIATFGLDRDVDAAAEDVRARVQSVMRLLPEDTPPPIIAKRDNDDSAVMTVALSGERSIRELSEIADKTVKVQLERAAGVGDVLIVGGQERAIKIWVDANRLAAYGLPITVVRAAIAEQNANIPGGNVTQGQNERTLRTLGRLHRAEQFDELVVATVNNAPVRVRDIGHAEDGTYEQRSLSRLNGKPTVVLELRRQSGANTVAVIEAAKQNLEKVRATLPADVSLETIQDQSRYIYAALGEINLHLVLGSILASLVVLLFMRSWRATVIAAVAIPSSVIATFAMMWALDFTLNSVTMLALVLMVGIVIDDAIVVLENIFRFVEEKQLSSFDAAREATREIGLAVLATTLSLVVIFVPVSFMSSISGRFLFQFGITAAVAVMVSLFVSFSLTPMMSARLLRGAAGSGLHGQAHSRSGFYARLDGAYARMLSFAMRRRLAVASLALVVVASSVPLYGMVRQEYVPSDVDEAEFEVRITAPLDASVAAMDDVMLWVDGELRSIRGVRRVLVTAGSSFIGGVNSGRAYVGLVPHAERTLSISRVFRETLAGNPLRAFQDNYTQRDVMQEVRKKLKRHKELRVSVRNMPAFNLGGGNFEIDLAIQGPDLEQLDRYTRELKARAEKLGGIVDADTTLDLDKPELSVVIDRERAADLGVRTEDIATALQLMVGGDEEVSRFRDPSANENYNVQLRLLESDRDQAGVISRLYVARGAQAGGRVELVRLDNLVRIEASNSPSRIDRLDRQRVASLRAGVAPGYALADRLEALKGAVREMDLPGQRARTRRGARAYVWRVHLGLPVLRAAHVHDSGLAVRESDPSGDDFAGAAAVDTLCAAQPVGHR